MGKLDVLMWYFTILVILIGMNVDPRLILGGIIGTISSRVITKIAYRAPPQNTEGQ